MCRWKELIYRQQTQIVENDIKQMKLINHTAAIAYCLYIIAIHISVKFETDTSMYWLCIILPALIVKWFKKKLILFYKYI